jgi:prepilin-type N-terminal cleavage/methylation domain-containing protein
LVVPLDDAAASPIFKSLHASGTLVFSSLLCRSSGFTLIELVVVVMIFGIIAAIAAPRLMSTSGQASDGAVRQSLDVIRNSIDTFAAQHAGALPGADGQEATFKSDISAYLRGAGIPKCPVGAAKNDAVRMMAGSASVASTISGTDTTQSWVYHYETGDFNVNSAETSADRSTTYDQF